MTPGSVDGALRVVGSEAELTLKLRLVNEPAVLSAAFAALQKNACNEAEAQLVLAESQHVDALSIVRLRARHARRCGSLDEAKHLLRKAVQDGRAQGRLSDAVDDKHLLAFIQMTRDFDFEAARALLWGEEDDLSRCPECQLDAAYYKSIWAVETGRYKEALYQLEKVLRKSARLGLADRRRAAENQRMEVLATLGRTREAVAIANGLLTEAPHLEDPCAVVKLQTSAAWALTRGVGREDRVSQTLHSAHQAVERARAECPTGMVTALVNAAFIEVELGELPKAKALLAEAQKYLEKGDVRMTSWLQPLQVEVALRDDPAQLLRRVSPTVDGQVTSPEIGFRALSGRARALRRTAQLASARDAYTTAHEALDQWSALVPLGEGRETFFELHERWAAESVDFAVQLAETAAGGSSLGNSAAKAVAEEIEHNIGRAFYTLAQSEQVSLSSISDYRRGGSRSPANASKRVTRITTPPPGTVDLFYHPKLDGWVGVALSSEATSVIHIPSGPIHQVLANPTTLSVEAASLLLDPFADILKNAQRVRVPALGPLRNVPFEALPWNNTVLSDQIQVSYRFPALGKETGKCTQMPRAVGVFDPSQNLPGAERSTPAVRDAISGRGYEWVQLTGSEATREAVLAQLENPCTHIFHYDGHAAFLGRDGVEAALELWGGRLRVVDILGLQHVPKYVSLLGCETAKDDGMGLAHAFLAAGAGEVLAAIDVVDDTLSERVAAALYLPAAPGLIYST
ncbi:MAG: CHAT domain-containing protein [Polyangiaceae bacterium]|nr:CHAT domain-containing protein [Polyangiaceae bacterium]